MGPARAGSPLGAQHPAPLAARDTSRREQGTRRRSRADPTARPTLGKGCGKDKCARRTSPNEQNSCSIYL
jgi:hypothetical protein